MQEALQLELNTAFQAREVMSEKGVTWERENSQLLMENSRLQQENDRLLREVNEMKRDYVHLEYQLVRACNKIQELRSRLHSSASIGQIMMVVGGLAAVFLLFYYGSGFVDFSASSTIENDAPVVERQR